jgi:hypothetical protein
VEEDTIQDSPIFWDLPKADRKAAESFASFAEQSRWEETSECRQLQRQEFEIF